MKNLKINIFLVVACGLAVVWIVPQVVHESLAQQGKGSQRHDERRGLKPIPIAKEETDLTKRADRERKNRKYNSRYGEDLTTQATGEIFGRVSEVPPSVPLPINESDLIVVGTIVRAQPYLSETRNRIYSEFSLKIEDTLKGITPYENNISFEKEGGALLLPDGQILQYFVGGTGALPELDLKYIVFLKKAENQNEYEILTGYELNTKGVLPLDGYADRDIFRGMSEQDFLAEVKRKIDAN